MQKTNDFDVIVIGGGPAGMMAAGTAAKNGARVALIEKKPRPGRKLLITGNGRCNLTNVSHDLRGLVGIYGPNGKFLYNSISRLGVDDTIEFFNKLGVGTMVEDNGRVFPVSQQASDVLKALERYMADGGVTVMTGGGADGLSHSGGSLTGVKTGGGVLSAGSYVLCTGGKSYPGTGSTGEAFGWLKSLGHTVTPLTPALTPIAVREAWVCGMEGASLKGVKISAYMSGKRLATVTGDAVVTATGLSGPAVLDLSRVLSGISSDEITIRVDLMPDINMEGLSQDIIDLISFTPKRMAKTFAAEFLTPKLADTILALSEIDGETQLNAISKKQRMALCWQIKVLTLTLKELGGFDRAMITRGGVSLSEIDPMTMRSKLVDNLYFAGEILDIDGPTGGYNLQVCWSTGYVAGVSAVTLFGQPSA